MARRGKGGWGFGRSLMWLVVEISGIGLIVAALPKVPLGDSRTAISSSIRVADQPPRLIAEPSKLARPSFFAEPREFPQLDPATNRWMVQSTPITARPARDQQFVQRKLDDAGQKLLSGVSFYIHEAAEEVLSVPDDAGR